MQEVIPQAALLLCIHLLILDPAQENKKAIIYMVTPYMDHDLSGLLENPEVQFNEAQIKCYMLQLLEGVRFLHTSHILHRDLKAANLLINNKGILQIADFGLARYYDGPSPKPGQGGGEGPRDYTQLVVTRWYRPPELLLGLRKYTTAIDMWGVGCIFGEMFEKSPILAGDTDLNQAQVIFDLIGTPNEENMPGWNALPGYSGNGHTGLKDFKMREGNIDRRFSKLSPPALSLLKNLLCLNWRTRLNAYDALRHPYFITAPLPAIYSELPRYKESHELDRRRFREMKHQPAGQLPPAPAGGSVGNNDHGDAWYNGARNHNDRRAYRDRDYDRGRDRLDRSRLYDRCHTNRHRHPNDRRPPPNYDRPRDGYRERDRPPPSGPPPPYDSRREPRHPNPGDRERPRPAWARESSRAESTLPPPPEGLPRRPPNNEGGRNPRNNDSGRPRPGGAGGGGTGGGRDTYIPSYSRDAQGGEGRSSGREPRNHTRSRSRSPMRSPAYERANEALAKERANPYGRR